MKYYKPAVYLDAIKFVYTAQGGEDLREFCRTFNARVESVMKIRRPGALAEANIIQESGHKTRLREGDYLFMHKDNVIGYMSAERFEMMYQPISD